MKQIFDFLRKISGGTLTQKQVDAANQVIATATDATVADMLGIAIDQMAVSPFGVDLICSFEESDLLPMTMGWECGRLVSVPRFIRTALKSRKVIPALKHKLRHTWHMI
jgi:hypothetical protein